MNLGRPLDAVAKWVLRPIGAWAHVGLWLMAVWGVWLSFWMMSRLVLVVCFLFPLTGFLVLICVRQWTRRVVVARYRQPDDALRVDDAFDRRRGKVIRIVLILIATRAPMYAAWWASRPWMDQLAREVADAPVYAPIPTTRWVGLYRAYPAWVNGGVRVGLTPGVGFGQAFRGPREQMGEGFYEPLGGGWYTDF
jgi:hypothetical protein